MWLPASAGTLIECNVVVPTIKNIYVERSGMVLFLCLLSTFINIHEGSGPIILSHVSARFSSAPPDSHDFETRCNLRAKGTFLSPHHHSVDTALCAILCGFWLTLQYISSQTS